LVTVETVEYLGFLALALALYAYFFYWFASKNRKVDVYIQPKLFRWQIETTLLLLGTIIILVLFQPSIFFEIVAGVQIPFMQSLPLSLIFLPILLFVVLLGLVVYPGVFVLGWAILGLMGGLLFPQLSALYWSYVAAIVMIFLALFASARHSVDTLILRVKEVGDLDLAHHMEDYGRIGIGSFFIGLLLPTALFTRWIRRATKTGVVKITLSVTPSGMDRVRGRERWVQKWTTVTLERMSESFQEVLARVDNMEKRFRRIHRV
jgi:hypothetical protein